MVPLILFFLGSSFFLSTATFAEPGFVIEDKEPIVENRHKVGVPQKIADNWLELLASLVLPGSYHFLRGDNLKGAIFLAVDVAAVGGHIHYTRDGDQIWQDSKEFADRHFSPERYFEFRDTLFLSERFMMLSNVIRFDTVGHIIRRDSIGNIIKDLDYYEMIGKYLKFTQGWDDVTPHFEDIISRYNQIYIPQQKGDSLLMYRQVYPDATGNIRYILDFESTYYQHIDRVDRTNSWALVPLTNFYFGTSRNALTYMVMRDDANRFYQKADYMIWILVVNRLANFAYALYDVIRREPEASEQTNNDFSSSNMPIIAPIVDINTNAKGVLFRWSF